MLNVIGLFFIYYFYLANTITHRDYTGDDSKSNLRRVLNYKIKVQL